MLGTLWRATRGHRLAPWRSPYLRWRLETYTGTPAGQIDFQEFWRQMWRYRKDLLRYLRWADRMQNR